MEYTKPHQSINDQVSLLIQRGLICDDLSDMENKLYEVSYYRLSAYWHCFKKPIPGQNKRDCNFQTNTSFDTIWNHYTFDRQLKLLLFDAIERIEIAIRTRLVHTITEKFGVFGYTNPQIAHDIERHNQWLISFRNCVQRARKSSACVQHFYKEYGDVHSDTPMWVGAETLTYGCVNQLFQSIHNDLRADVIAHLPAKYEILQSWLIQFNFVRNACAHHEYVWNRVWKRTIKFPKTLNSTGFPLNKTGAIILICRLLLKTIAPHSQWHKRMESLFLDYSQKNINFNQIGLPHSWQNNPIWK